MSRLIVSEIKMKPRTTLIVAVICAASATSIAIGARELVLRASRAGGALTLNPQVIQFVGEVGKATSVTVTLANGGSAPVKVVGSEDTCGVDGCMAILDHHFTIKAGGDCAVTVELKPFKSGGFDRTITLFTDSPGQGRFKLRAVGWIK